MTESTIIKLICAYNGSMTQDELIATAGFGSFIINDIIANQEKFPTVYFNGEKKVIVKTKVRLCKTKNCLGCDHLHLCKKFLFGECTFGNGRRRCIFSHDLNSAPNAKVLREHNLEELDRTELCILLLQNDNSLLPPICYDYNNGVGEYGKCESGDNCSRLHICQKFLKGSCSCPRAHDFYEPNPSNILQRRGVPNQLIHYLKSVYLNKEALKIHERCNTSAASNATSPNAAGAKQQKPKRNDKTVICLYFVKGHCRHGDQCFKAHHNLPYQWEVKQGQQWIGLPNNEEIEKDYSDPRKSYSRCVEPVCFDTMTRGLNSIRRLSTPSSVLQPNFVLTTEWLWYWEDEHGNWNEYTSANQSPITASVISADLEEKYQNNNNDIVKFTAGTQKYSLSFQDMIQTNNHYGTKRLVRRRSKFVSSVEAQQIKTRRPTGNQSTFRALPGHWNKTQAPDTGHKRVTLQVSSAEYKEIEGLFRNTMRDFQMVQIERIQNKALWEVFQWQKDLMKKTNGVQNVTEKKLFHGTDSKHIDAICHNNFDWRICGTHGTAYGKGSYFARDANYSHNYTGDSIVKSMFVSRVLVGDYTKGSSSYLRPPSKDGGDTRFYDSCVDDVINPSIFVVFEKHQIYPEYLLTYKEKVSHNFEPVMAATTYIRPTPAPAPARAPAPAPAPASTPVRLTYASPYTSHSSNQSKKKDSDSCVIN